MPVRLSFGQEQAAQDAVRAIAVAERVMLEAPRIALEDVDDAVTEHIASRFQRPPWAPLKPATLYLRSLARGRLPKGLSSSAVGKLWYRRQSAKIGAPQSSRSYGWTRGAEAAALARGKVKGVVNPVLTRDFRSKGKQARQRLEWWHFGTTQNVTPRQRAFLHRVGIHLRKSTKTIKRAARPIYDETEIRRIAGPRFERRIRDIMAAVQEGAPGLFSTTVVRR